MLCCAVRHAAVRSVCRRLARAACCVWRGGASTQEKSRACVYIFPEQIGAGEVSPAVDGPTRSAAIVFASVRVRGAGSALPGSPRAILTARVRAYTHTPARLSLSDIFGSQRSGIAVVWHGMAGWLAGWQIVRACPVRLWSRPLSASHVLWSLSGCSLVLWSVYRSRETRRLAFDVLGSAVVVDWTGCRIPLHSSPPLLSSLSPSPVWCPHLRWCCISSGHPLT